MKKNKRAKITEGVQITLWPDENGLLQIVSVARIGKTPRNTLRLAEPSALLSPRSQLSRHVKRATTSPQRSFFSSSLWLSLRSRIIYSFDRATDHYFVTWLTARVLNADFQAISLKQIERDAVQDLGLDPERIKRLLIKHTSVSGEFVSDGRLLTLR